MRMVRVGRVVDVPRRVLAWVAACLVWWAVVVLVEAGDARLKAYLVGALVLLPVAAFVAMGTSPTTRSRTLLSIALIAAWVSFSIGLVVGHEPGTRGTASIGPRWNDLFFLVCLLLLSFVFALVIVERSTPGRRREIAFDVAVTAATTNVGLWAFALGRWAAVEPLPSQVLLAVYGLLASLVVGVAVGLVLVSPRSVAGTATLLMACSLGGFLTVFILARGTYVEDLLQQALPLFCAVGGLAVFHPTSDQLLRTSGERPPGPTMSHRRAVVTAIALIVVGLSLTELDADHSGAQRAVGFAAVAVAVGALAGQAGWRLQEVERRRTAERLTSSASTALASAGTADEVAAVVAAAVGALTGARVVHAPSRFDDVTVELLESHLRARLLAQLGEHDPGLPAVALAGRRRSAAAVVVVGDGSTQRYTIVACGRMYAPGLGSVLANLASQASLALVALGRVAQSRQHHTAMQAAVLMDWVGAPALVLGADGTVVTIAPRLADMLRWPETQLVGIGVAVLVHPDDRGRLSALVAAGPGSGEPARLRFRQGTARFVELDVRVERVLDDARVRLVVSTPGRTESAAAPPTLLTRRAASIDRAPIGVAVERGEGEPLYANPAYPTLLAHRFPGVTEVPVAADGVTAVPLDGVDGPDLAGRIVFVSIR